MRHQPDELQRLVADFAEKRCGTRAPQIESLGGHASYRLYYRARAGDRSFMIMELGPDPLGSEEVSDGERPAELPFLAVQRYLSAGGVAVPEVYAYLEAPGLVLLEDLGDETLEARVLDAGAEERRALYRQAIADLAAIQRYTANGGDCVCFSRRFDHALLRWELDHFREWLLEAERGVTLTPGELARLGTSFDGVAAELAALPPVWVHRDYQSRNLMLQRTAAGETRLRLIDFQDALLGPPPYDLVALLRDSYVDLGIELVEELLDHYLDCADPPLSGEAFKHAFWLQALQRKLKDSGRFVFIDRVKGNPSFLRHMPLSLRYVAEAFDRLPELEGLRKLLSKHIEELS